MTADPFIDSLTNKTSPVPYDQVIVLSQKIINDSFYNMWVLADDTSPIRSINLKTRDGQTLTGKLKAPTIIVNVVDYTYMLYFQWNFNSGSMTLYTTDNPNDPTTKTFDLTNWVVAFGTTMSTTPAKSHPDTPNSIFSEGNYPTIRPELCQLCKTDGCAGYIFSCQVIY
jgi:hypothetical protein